MSGLPVLLIGLVNAVAALSALSHPLPDMAQAISSAIAAVPLIVIALRLRGGHAGWLPLVMALLALLLAINLVLSLAMVGAVGATSARGMRVLPAGSCLRSAPSWC